MKTLKALLLLVILAIAGHASAQNTIFLSSSTYSVNENGGAANVVVQVNPGHTGTITVNFATSDGTAKKGSDYFSASGTLTFAPNETAKLVQVSIINDFIFEPSETFTFTLSSPTNATLGTSKATITIIDDDGSSDGINTIQFTSADYGAVETQGSVFLTLTAERRGDPNQTLTVQLDIGQPGDTAMQGIDYTAPASQTVMFPPGINVVNVSVTVIDRPDEGQGNTFFTAVLSNPGPFTSVGQQATSRATILDNNSPPTVQLLAMTTRVREGDQTIAIPVFRTGVDNNTVTKVSFTTELRNGDTAQAGVNFTSTSGNFNFGEGQKEAFIVIPIPNNDLVQGDVTFHVTLTSSDNTQLGMPNTEQIVVEDDDTGNVAQFSSATYSVSEAGGFAMVTVNLDPSGDPSRPSVVDFSATSITAFSGFDFTPINTTLVFQSGEFSKTVLIPILQDSITEPSETFRVTLSNPGVGTVLGAQSTSIVTILDDDLADVVQFSPVDYTVAENGKSVALTVNVSRANNPNDTITVHYNTVDNTATGGKDYSKILAGTLVFGPGDTQKSITVNITDDVLIEGAEEFFVTLTDATAQTTTGETASAAIGVNGTATITILDDDSPDATIGFSQDTFTADEGDSFANLTVTRSGGLGVSATVQFSTMDGSAVAGVNYVKTTGSVTFGVGEVSKIIKIPLIDDTTQDPTLSFSVTLTAADGSGFVGGRSMATVNINDNDATTIRFNPGSYSVDEGSGTAVLTVEALRVGDPTETLTVDFVTSDGTAKEGQNYSRVSGQLTFGPNVTSQTITVPIIDNNSTDGTTSFTVLLSNPTGGAGGADPQLGTPSTATVSIIDNDATTFQFSSLNYTANNQAGVANATVTLSRIGDPNVTYSVDFATSDLSAVAGRDYVATSGKLTFGPGVTSKTISVPLIDQTVGSPTRTFIINLSNPTNGAFLGTISSASVDITNPDLSTKPVNISTRGLVQSGDGVMIAGFIIQGASSKEVIVRGLGPSLTQRGVVGALQDPTLDLRDRNGNQIFFDDDFGDSQAAQIAATNLAPTDSREAAIVADLPPEQYTAILRGKTNGIGEVEVFDLDTTSATHLVNISTRAFIGSGDNNALIGGFIIDGQSSQQVLVRALGPSLAAAGVTGALTDPTIDFYRGSQLILSNDNWKTTNEAAIAATGLAPSDDKESALLVTLDPGSYTAVIRGKNNTTGIGLVEVYQMP